MRAKWASGATGSASTIPATARVAACVEVNGKRSAARSPAHCPRVPGRQLFYQLAPLSRCGLTLINVNIPVCLPNDRCELLSSTTRVSDRVRGARRRKGSETSCVHTGTAKPGDACDDARRCAEGLICSSHEPVPPNLHVAPARPSVQAARARRQPLVAGSRALRHLRRRDFGQRAHRRGPCVSQGCRCRRARRGGSF